MIVSTRETNLADSGNVDRHGTRGHSSRRFEHLAGGLQHRSRRYGQEVPVVADGAVRLSFCRLRELRYVSESIFPMYCASG